MSLRSFPDVKAVEVKLVIHFQLVLESLIIYLHVPYTPS
jgi:hypothetical protein